MKVLIEGFCVINVRIAHISSNFQCGYTYVVCSSSSTYDQKHFGFSTYDIVNIFFTGSDITSTSSDNLFVAIVLVVVIYLKK